MGAFTLLNIRKFLNFLTRTLFVLFPKSSLVIRLIFVGVAIRRRMKKKRMIQMRRRRRRRRKTV